MSQHFKPSDWEIFEPFCLNWTHFKAPLCVHCINCLNTLEDTSSFFYHPNFLRLCRNSLGPNRIEKLLAAPRRLSRFNVAPFQKFPINKAPHSRLSSTAVQYSSETPVWRVQLWGEPQTVSSHLKYLCFASLPRFPIRLMRYLTGTSGLALDVLLMSYRFSPLFIARPLHYHQIFSTYWLGLMHRRAPSWIPAFD